MDFFKLFFYIFMLAIVRTISGDGCVTDTIFLLDSSGSIRKSFELYKQYVRGLLEQMPISPEGHHASLIVYSGRLRQFTKWALNDTQNKELILQQAEALPHLNGVTATGVALDVVTHRELPKRRKSATTRTNLILLTDGFSYDPIEIQSENIRAMPDVRTFSVCLDDINVHSDLVTFAGTDANVYIGQESQSNLLPKLLDCPAPPPSAKSKANKQSSKNKTINQNEEEGGQEQVEPAADVPSGSGQADEQQGREGEGTGSPEEASGTYEGGPGGAGDEQNDTETSGDGPPGISPSSSDASGSNEAGFSSENGTEPSAAEPAGGGNASAGTNGSKKAKGKGEKSSPSTSKKGGSNQDENATKMTTQKPLPRMCPTDFLFILDGSGSLRQRFEHQKEMAAELVEALPNGDGIRIGIIKYSGRGKVRIKLPIDNKLSRPAIQQVIREQRFFGGTTFTNEALQKAMGELDKQIDGARQRDKAAASQQVVVVFTDGMSQEDPTEGAKALHGKGAIVYSIAVEDGQPIHRKELELIAGDPGRVFTDNNFEELKRQMREFPKNC